MEALSIVAVWALVAAHSAFLLYLPAGGFLALRWRRTIGLHVAAVSWAVASVTLGLWCPLTSAERWARREAGMAPISPTGFIDHYIAGVFYPAAGTAYVQAAVFTAVAVSWIAYAITTRRPTRSPAGPEGKDVSGMVSHRCGAR